MDDRLTILETRISYQDLTIAELNEVVIRQQQQIDQLERVLEQLRAYIKQQDGSGLAHAHEEVPPPHY